MRISRRFRWAIGFGSLKVLAATVLFVYGKHKGASPPVTVPAAMQTPVPRPHAQGKDEVR